MFVNYLCHSLRRLCGLKLYMAFMMIISIPSQPAKAVWIEIYVYGPYEYCLQVTACEGCVD